VEDEISGVKSYLAVKTEARRTRLPGNVKTKKGGSPGVLVLKEKIVRGKGRGHLKAASTIRCWGSVTRTPRQRLYDGGWTPFTATAWPLKSSGDLNVILLLVSRTGV